VSKKVKAAAMILLIIMVMSFFIGCAGGEDKQSANNMQQSSIDNKTESKQAGSQNKVEEQESNFNETGFPIVKERMTLTVLASKAVHEVPYEEMEVFKEYEKKTNIHIEWDNPPAESFEERYNIVMASGDLPDVIVRVPGGDIQKYGKMGAFIPLNDLIDKYAPNLKGLMEKYPDLKKILTQSDGTIYHTAYFNPYSEPDKIFTRLNNPLQIREDWLKKLNLEEPVTTDDWYNVWKAFKTQDPNGNGKPDEIPFSGSSLGWVRSLVRAWGVEDGFYLPKDSNEVHYGPIESRYKEAIEWINQMYSEGLIDQEIATNDEQAFQGKMAQNLIGSYRGLLGSHMRSFNETLPATIPGFSIIGTVPMKGPYGDQQEPLGNMDRGNYTVITKDNEYPEITMRWLDFFYGEEGSVFVTFGPFEGKTYIHDNGRYKYTDYVHKNPDGLSAKEAIGTFSPVQSGWPQLYHYDMNIEMNPPYNVEAMQKMAPYAIPTLPTLSFSQEDDELRRQIMADVQTFVDENITKFILGQEPISKWDEYVNRVKEMGIEKVIEIYQKAYDEWLKK